MPFETPRVQEEELASMRATLEARALPGGAFVSVSMTISPPLCLMEHASCPLLGQSIRQYLGVWCIPLCGCPTLDFWGGIRIQATLAGPVRRVFLLVAVAETLRMIRVGARPAGA